MAYLGQICVFRARKEHTCSGCKHQIDRGDWYIKQLGRIPEIVKGQPPKFYASRFHRDCFLLRLGQAMTGKVEDRDRAGTGAMSPQERADRRRLVSLRNYHLRAGHEDRVAEIDKRLEAAGTPVRDAVRSRSDEELAEEKAEADRKLYFEERAARKKAMWERAVKEQAPAGEPMAAKQVDTSGIPKGAYRRPDGTLYCLQCDTPWEPAKKHARKHREYERNLEEMMQESFRIAAATSASPAEGEEE